MLFAERDGTALAVACTPCLGRAGSAGFVGFSDGWQDLIQHGQMSWTYDRAANGNVALTGEIDLTANDGTFVVALAFGSSAFEAGASRAAEPLRTASSARTPPTSRNGAPGSNASACRSRARATAGDPTRTSAAVLRCHEEKAFPGGLIASLSIPWGAEKATRISAAIIWSGRAIWSRPREACSPPARTRTRVRVLQYLRTTQEADGSLAAEHVARRRARTGTASRWTNPPSRSCWSIWSGASALEMSQASRASGRWCGAPPASSSATARSTEQDRWEEDAGLLAVHARRRDRGAARRRRSCRRLRGTAGRRRICARRPTRGTIASSAGLYVTDTALARARRRRWLLRPDRAAGDRRRGVAGRRLCADQEPAAGSRPTCRRGRSSAPMRWPWCGSACGRPMIRGSSTRVRVIDALLKVETAVRTAAGGDTTAMATANTRMGPPSTAPASAAHGRCSPASGRTMRSRQAARTRREDSSERWRRAPATAVCCPSKRGTSPIFHERELYLRPAIRLGDAARVGARRAPQAVSIAGRGPGVRLTARRPSSDTRLSAPGPDMRSGGSITGHVPYPKAGGCVWKPWCPASCTGAPTGGALCTIRKRVTPGSAST